MTSDEAILLAQLRRGSEEAFTQIYNRMFESLYASARRRVQSREVAEDVIHDVFLALWRRRATVDVHDSLSAYLHTAVRNRIVSHRRSEAARERLGGAAPIEVAVEDESPRADAMVALHEVEDALARALAALSPRRLEVFLVSRRDHLTTREIAASLGIAPKTVENLIGRALRQLRHSLSQFTLALVVSAMLG